MLFSFKRHIVMLKMLLIGCRNGMAFLFSATIPHLVVDGVGSLFYLLMPGSESLVHTT